jgi:hypothetical protein
VKGSDDLEEQGVGKSIIVKYVFNKERKNVDRICLVQISDQFHASVNVRTYLRS